MEKLIYEGPPSERVKAKLGIFPPRSYSMKDEEALQSIEGIEAILSFVGGGYELKVYHLNGVTLRYCMSTQSRDYPQNAVRIIGVGEENAIGQIERRILDIFSPSSSQ